MRKDKQGRQSAPLQAYGWYWIKIRKPYDRDDTQWIAAMWSGNTWIGVYSQSAVLEVDSRIPTPEERTGMPKKDFVPECYRIGDEPLAWMAGYKQAIRDMSEVNDESQPWQNGYSTAVRGLTGGD